MKIKIDNSNTNDNLQANTNKTITNTSIIASKKKQDISFNINKTFITCRLYHN